MFIESKSSLLSIVLDEYRHVFVMIDLRSAAECVHILKWNQINPNDGYSTCSESNMKMSYKTCFHMQDDTVQRSEIP